MKNTDNRFVATLLKDRRSVRKFNPDFKIEPEKLDLILEAARYSPTSYGVLNQRILVLSNKEIKQEMLPLFFYQDAFLKSSVYLMFIVDKGEYILSETVYKAENYMHVEDSFSKLKIDIANMNGWWDDKFNAKTLSNSTDWSIMQAYISMSAAMIQAEQVEIDTCPHEGFNRDKVDEYLVNHNYISTKETMAIGLALGKADCGHHRPCHYAEKVRKTKEDYIKEIK
ncbi:nitroreductase family protein [Mesoplasma lactucae]|uniref:Uncharacterized protein n=1 Tax=Mesoplasma lactucae ATCC 49193 TaxID=81460 RepID=A0A291IRZ9_9MOLU|nr:nitroreductase family protein [Mesoplasma lactucae]ATG97467.1 hypothetical protein CP520_01690 [Mesoplasma lactucae ATCC 49193]ATZ20078.1 NAD(P)H-dependent oxidoreductase [Mesoplasma lactucae ATCC 49193]MCL8216826.1 putative NAD(P)H nitroreductase [Mesoplasma lactucae ATCC 49193]